MFEKPVKLTGIMTWWNMTFSNSREVFSSLRLQWGQKDFFSSFAPLKVVPLCHSGASHPRRPECWIVCSNSNQVWLDGSSRQILTWQIQKSIGWERSGTARREDRTRHASISRVSTGREEWPPRFKWKRVALSAARQEQSELRERSELLTTGVSDVNKEAFQGGTLNITRKGKCADPEKV